MPPVAWQGTSVYFYLIWRQNDADWNLEFPFPNGACPSESGWRQNPTRWDGALIFWGIWTCVSCLRCFNLVVKQRSNSPTSWKHKPFIFMFYRLLFLFPTREAELNQTQAAVGRFTRSVFVHFPWTDMSLRHPTVFSGAAAAVKDNLNTSVVHHRLEESILPPTQPIKMSRTVVSVSWGLMMKAGSSELWLRPLLRLLMTKQDGRTCFPDVWASLSYWIVVSVSC